ncbi:type III secretion system inner rod subunit SctI [Cupriavidus sp. AU9028]|uniref:type III secretion system inner rod subunit SctI n=1 Tax=Cupriavidus sp. AU9028 TaxID=2871157 RepID=UPI001C98C361|nr:type III secretion system inner rod subunit SctI [Cupriavidus sp. AU9028]MBY4897870.1 type III secretion system inner rod subunit SctI [Cupriavidus sp. AU9028]
MNIDPTFLLDSLPRMGPATASRQEVEAFSAAMSAAARKPEQTVVETIGKLESGADRGIAQVLQGGPLDAEAVSMLQRKLLEQRTETDLIAKVAGVFSQALTKLTSLQ